MERRPEDGLRKTIDRLHRALKPGLQKRRTPHAGLVAMEDHFTRPPHRSPGSPPKPSSPRLPPPIRTCLGAGPPKRANSPILRRTPRGHGRRRSHRAECYRFAGPGADRARAGKAAPSPRALTRRPRRSDRRHPPATAASPISRCFPRRRGGRTRTHAQDSGFHGVLVNGATTDASSTTRRSGHPRRAEKTGDVRLPPPRIRAGNKKAYYEKPAGKSVYFGAVGLGLHADNRDPRPPPRPQAAPWIAPG